MLLPWDELAHYYGNEINIYRPNFETAGWNTFGLLCCRLSPGDYQLEKNANTIHAEEYLLGTETWREHIPNAIENWEPGNSSIIVTMILNRSPCRNCTELLVQALIDLHIRFPLRAQQHRFILAARGAYEDVPMVMRTTRQNLISLKDAGWDLCVLQVGSKLSARGGILLKGLELLNS